jgi:hypothetical protein
MDEEEEEEKKHIRFFASSQTHTDIYQIYQ